MEILWLLGGIVLGGVVVGAILLSTIRRRNGRRMWDEGIEALEVALRDQRSEDVDWFLKEYEGDSGALLSAKVKMRLIQQGQQAQQGQGGN